VPNFIGDKSMMCASSTPALLDINLVGLKTIASTKRLAEDSMKAVFDPTIIPSLLMSYQLLLADQLKSLWVMSNGISPKYRF
jgi:hypothetical protein